MKKYPIGFNTHIYGENNSEEFSKQIWDEHYSHHNFNLFINRGSKFEQQGRIHNLAESKEKDAEIKQMLDENMVYYGNYYHKTVPVIIDNIVKTLNRIQAYEEQDEDDEEMEF